MTYEEYRRELEEEYKIYDTLDFSPIIDNFVEIHDVYNWISKQTNNELPNCVSSDELMDYIRKRYNVKFIHEEKHYIIK